MPLAWFLRRRTTALAAPKVPRPLESRDRLSKAMAGKLDELLVSQRLFCYHIHVRVLQVIIANIIGLFLADYLISGFNVEESWKGFLIAGIILGLLNLILKPILKFISAPLIVVTLGLFTLVINAFLIWLTAHFTGLVSFSGYVPLLWATLLISIINFIANGFHY